MYAIIERPDNGATAKQIISKVSQEVLLPAEQIEGHYCDNRFPSRKPIDHTRVNGFRFFHTRN